MHRRGSEQNRPGRENPCGIYRMPSDILQILKLEYDRRMGPIGNTEQYIMGHGRGRPVSESFVPPVSRPLIRERVGRGGIGTPLGIARLNGASIGDVGICRFAL